MKALIKSIAVGFILGIVILSLQACEEQTPPQEPIEYSGDE